MLFRQRCLVNNCKCFACNEIFVLDQILVVLTSTGQLCLFAKDGTVIHQTSFSLDGYGGDDLVAYHTHFINIYGNPEKAFHNCIEELQYTSLDLCILLFLAFSHGRNGFRFCGKRVTGWVH